MAALPIIARSAQTSPLAQKAARRAARLWFAGAPLTTLAAWRDDACRQHCSGLPDLAQRADAFSQAFSQELAAINAGVRHE